MTPLVADVTAVLRDRGIPFAMIGAGALAVHGVSRSTADLDLLTMDAGCLEADAWRTMDASTTVDVRRGDSDDPLCGVVRFRRPDEPDVDLIIGRPAWQAGCIARAVLRTELDIPVVGLADLILLKLYAGGSQDAWDIEQLLAIDVAGAAAREVAARLEALPADAHLLWTRLRT